VKAKNPASVNAVKPFPTAQQRMNLRELESAIEASVALLLLLKKEIADSGIDALADNAIGKLNADFSTFAQSFTAEVAA
jgi:hypothetical protein